MGNGNKPGTIRRRIRLPKSPLEYGGLPDCVAPGEVPRNRCAQPDHRFTRRLLSVFRDPAAALFKVLCCQFGLPGVKDLRRILSPDALQVLRAGVYNAIAFRSLLLIQDWHAFTPSSDLTRARATAQYTRRLRRHGVETSKSSLYRCEAQFEKQGLVGLVPSWFECGERGRRIPPAEMALVDRLCCWGAPWRDYELLHYGYGLPGEPISEPTYRRRKKELREQATPDARHQPARRKPTAPKPNPRVSLRAAA